METTFLISYIEYDLFTGHDINKNFEVSRKELYAQLQKVFYSRNTKSIKVSKITKIEYEENIDAFIQNLND